MYSQKLRGDKEYKQAFNNDSIKQKQNKKSQTHYENEFYAHRDYSVCKNLNTT